MKNKCEHNLYKDEPPQCLECGSWLCGICLSGMSNDTGICEDCLKQFSDVKISLFTMNETEYELD